MRRVLAEGMRQENAHLSREETLLLFCTQSEEEGATKNNIKWFDGVIVPMATWFSPNRAQHTPSPAHAPLTSYRQDAVVTISDSVTPGRINPALLLKTQVNHILRGKKAFVPLAEFLLASREPLQRTQQAVLHSAWTGQTFRPCRHPEKTLSPLRALP